MNPTFILRVKKPSDMAGQFDVFDVLGEVPGAQLYRPADAAAGTVQFNAEYYPDGRRYGAAHHDPQATAYIRALP